MSESKPSLLVVEDDIDLAEMLAAYFRALGYDVMAVHTGQDAVQACRSAHPTLVILDIRLPDIDGFEVAQRLRRNQRTGDIPFIFLTDMREHKNRLQGLELGADDFITKPFDIQELRLRVRNALRRSSESPLNNPVTGLPEGALVDERLLECLQTSNWGALVISLEHLAEFRDAYGFVASDDVQRAVSLMIHNAMRGYGSANDFLGHLSPTMFLLITQPGNLAPLSERILSLLDQSFDYFYPLKDRLSELPSESRLNIQIHRFVPLPGLADNLDDLKQYLSHL